MKLTTHQKQMIKEICVREIEADITNNWKTTLENVSDETIILKENGDEEEGLFSYLYDHLDVEVNLSFKFNEEKN